MWDGTPHCTSWIDTNVELNEKGRIKKVSSPVSSYQPNDEVKERLAMVRSDMQQGDVTMKRPRREFNDLMMVERLAVDQMAWSVYQPNDGDALEGDLMNAWRSNAVRPIVRNKVFSIAAHVTAHTLFPKIFAYDDDSIEQHQAAQIMSDLLEYSVTSTSSSYTDVALSAVIAALVNPVSIVYTEYAKIYRQVKREKDEQGKWIIENVLDEDLSGFVEEVVPPEQLFIQDFYQRDIQKQGWVIRRRVRPYTYAKALYRNYAEFAYVKPGVQVIYNDANGQQFYDVYDSTQRQDEVEEVLYWNKSLDLFLIIVNGVLINEPDTPNPREDKLYPLVTFGYEFLRPAGDSFYWKSLAFKTMPDDRIVNTLYPMIIDGSYLAIMPPMVNVGGEVIEGDVVIPGRVTTFSNPDADLRPLAVQTENLKAGFEALQKVEEDINESSFNSLLKGEMPEGGGNLPAQTVARLEENALMELRPFLDMVGRYVKQIGRLRIGDIKQHLTIPEVAMIEGEDQPDLLYKTILLPSSKGRSKSHKIKFSIDLPDSPMTPSEYLKYSYAVLHEQGGPDGKQKLSYVNPMFFRKINFLCHVGTDVLKPLSEWAEASWNLSTYDRMVEAPPGMFDPQETAKLLLEASPTTKKHPEKYVAKKQLQQPGRGQSAQPQANTPVSTGAAPGGLPMGGQ